MHELIGLLSKLKYQTEDYLNHTIPNSSTLEQIETTRTAAIQDIRHTVDLINTYIHTNLALVYEKTSIYNNIDSLTAKLADQGIPIERFQFEENDYHRITNSFVQSIHTPQNQEWLEHLLTNAVLTRLFEREHPHEHTLAFT